MSRSAFSPFTASLWATPSSYAEANFAAARLRPCRSVVYTSTRMAPPSDRELVDRARGGDAGAFDDLVRRHHARIHRLALQMLRDRAEAEDVAQETFIRAYQALARFDGRSEPYTWIYRIAVNLSLNLLRSRRGQISRVDVQDPRLDGLLAETRPSAKADPPGDAERKELYIALCESIDALSETLRTTLILVCIEGRSHDEASAILGAPPGTIAWRVHEARRKLKAMLGERGFEVDESPERDERELRAKAGEKK
jgi:RNA polymerase sigma-70 factor, ECF subfamily